MHSHILLERQIIHKRYNYINIALDNIDLKVVLQKIFFVCVSTFFSSGNLLDIVVIGVSITQILLNVFNFLSVRRVRISKNVIKVGSERMRDDGRIRIEAPHLKMTFTRKLCLHASGKSLNKQICSKVLDVLIQKPFEFADFSHLSNQVQYSSTAIRYSEFTKKNQSEVGIYKRKQESENTRKQELD